MFYFTLDFCRRALPGPARTIHVFALTLVLFVLTLGRPEPAFATNVSGTISVPTTWNLAGSPYVMTGNVTVAAGVTLTIEQGVVVQGNAVSRQLVVNGSLLVNGSAEQHVTFTSTTDSAYGQWTGIKFNAGAGTSTIKYADIRYGGGSATSDLNGMVDVAGGTVTFEDSTFKASSVSGLKVSGGTSGTNASVTIKRSLFYGNGFQGGNLRGDGMNVNNARVVVEDSAFWANANDGVDYTIGAGYTPSPGEFSGSSFWTNNRYGVYLSQAVGVEALAPDGNVAGKPGNAIYDNGTFGFSVLEKWTQLSLTRASIAVDWSRTYWGPVHHYGCGYTSPNGIGLNGYLSYGVVDPDPLASNPLDRGPVPHTIAFHPTNPHPDDWCGNDSLLVNPATYEYPDLFFDARRRFLEDS